MAARILLNCRIVFILFIWMFSFGIEKVSWQSKASGVSSENAV
jgi:hypothetical protein